MARRRIQKNDITVEIPWEFLDDIADWVAKEAPKAVRTSAQLVASYARSLAPKGKTGDLRRGIIVPSHSERSGTPGKTVYDVYMDPSMSDTFVKMAGSGRSGGQQRYYYPASIEYGFRKRGAAKSEKRLGGFARSPAYPMPKADRVPGRYFMKTASIVSGIAHNQAMSEALDRILEDLKDD